MPSPALPVPVAANATGVWVGDSFIGPGALTPHGEITAGLGAVLGWQINNLAAKQYARVSPSVNTRARAPVAIPQITMIDNGVQSTGVSSLATPSRYATVIADLPASTPAILFWLVSQNDMGAAGNFSLWQPYAETFINAVVAARPNVVVVMIKMLFGNGEKVNRSGAAWGLNSNDAACDLLNAQVETWAAARGYYVIDVRGTLVTDANTIANWEFVNNPTQQAFGPAFLTQDGGHPNIVTGQGIICGFIAQRLALPFS